jgi:protein-disulfide isomerase
MKGLNEIMSKKTNLLGSAALAGLLAFAVSGPAIADDLNAGVIELAQADTEGTANEDTGTESTETEGATDETASAVEAPAPEGEVDMEAVLEEGPLEEMVLGEADAPVTIVEYMSMTCPHCAAFHNETFDALKEKYIETGQVRFIMRDFPFDPRAAAATMLARCADDGKYFPMVDMLFEQQQQWAAAEDARGALLQLSRMAGFTQESFEECLTNQQLLDDVNAVRERAAEEFGVQSTPSFIINGERYAGNMSIEQMSAIIDGKL